MITLLASWRQRLSLIRRQQGNHNYKLYTINYTLRNYKLYTINYTLLLLGLLVACGEQPEPFTHDVVLSYTPVKQQGESQLCWVYAMLAAIETEHIGRGDSVCLSPAFVARSLHADSIAAKQQRGMAATLISLIGRYGVVPFDAMPSLDWPLPHKAFMFGVEYTPQEFGRSVCAPGEYVALTSRDDHPYYKEVELPLADNWTHERFLNLPADSLLRLTGRAVRARHGVCWEGDTGDPGFDWQHGVARLTLLSKASKVSDDHCMAIVGLAHDAQGEPFFIMKNSWGTNNAYGGLLYMSFDYFVRNTVSVVLPRSLVENEN